MSAQSLARFLEIEKLEASQLRD